MGEKPEWENKNISMNRIDKINFDCIRIENENENENWNEKSNLMTYHAIKQLGVGFENNGLNEKSSPLYLPMVYCIVQSIGNKSM